MQEPIETSEIEVVSTLATSFYSTVPLRYRTYCSLTSRIAREALRRLGFAWQLVPCQLWYAGTDRNHVIGFVGSNAPGKWDGHVICASRDWFIDAAVHHLHLELGIESPSVIVGPRFNVPSQTIARHDLRTGERLWWHHPPAGADPRPPEEPAALVDEWATALHEEVRRRLLATASRY